MLKKITSNPADDERSRYCEECEARILRCGFCVFSFFFPLFFRLHCLFQTSGSRFVNTMQLRFAWARGSKRKVVNRKNDERKPLSSSAFVFHAN